MHVAIVTLFPELFEQFLGTSFVGRAIAAEKLVVHLEPLRAQGLGNHNSVDDTPYGGGSGMVLRVDCVVQAIEAAEAKIGGRAHRVLLTPQGERLQQPAADTLAARERLVLICGRYEGFDERVRAFVDQELSLGDFILTGGEIAAMALIEASVRLLPGVLGNAASAEDESFSRASGGMLEYPQYTRPLEFRGHGVPEVLRSGHHDKISKWRAQMSLERTVERRPELVPKAKS
jgi:tRNA (guanine37-N1)-methyltransferase